MGTLSNPQIGGAISAKLSDSDASHKTTTQIDHISASSPVIGSSAGQVNKVIDIDFVVADDSTPTDIDLTNATDPQGNAVTLSAVRALKLSNASTVSGQKMTMSTVSNGLFATSQGPVHPCGSITLDVGGVDELVVDASHKVLSITVAAGTNVPGKLTILGR